MGTLKWYKRDPRAALHGMMKLTLEERGAYNTLLDLIYANDGAVDDDTRFIAGALGVDLRVWKRIRQRLIDLGKLYVKEGSLRNERADHEVLDALHRGLSAAEAGRVSAAKRGYGIRKINGMQITTVQRTLEPSTTTKKESSYLESERAETQRTNEKRTSPLLTTSPELQALISRKRWA